MIEVAKGEVDSYLRFDQPRSFFTAMSWGNCRYALPTINGAKVAAPQCPTISYAGDGAGDMNMMETMTCVRHNIPVTAVVYHNRQWGAEKKNQLRLRLLHLSQGISHATALNLDKVTALHISMDMATALFQRSVCVIVAIVV